MKAKVGAADRESRQIMETTEAHSMVKPMFFNESCTKKSQIKDCVYVTPKKQKEINDIDEYNECAKHTIKKDMSPKKRVVPFNPLNTCENAVP